MVRIAYLALIMFGVMAFIFMQPSAAQPAAADGASGMDLKYFDFFVVKGGFIAYGLIGLSVVTFALTIEHCLSIRRATIVPPHAIEHTKKLIDERKYVEAIKFTADDPSMAGFALNSGLMEAGNGFESMERAVAESIDDRSAKLFRKIEYMSIIGNVAPMVGLFGTVYGMILLFAEIHAADALPGASIVADKMAIALITTFWGLAVAIPALSIHALFRNHIDVLTSECALMADRLLAIFGPGGDKKTTAAQRATIDPASQA